MPAKLYPILDRDLRMAGIAKRDDRGRTLDVHALRTTFGTLLSKRGVAPRTAQAAMRHSDIELTMNVYTDPRLLDVRGALDVLPALPLDGDQAGRQSLRATGTEARTVAPTVAPNSDNRSTQGAIPVNLAGSGDSGGRGILLPQRHDVSTKTAGCHLVTAGRSDRGDRRLTFPNEPIAARLFSLALSQVEEFTADTFFRLADETAW